jgi:hypothetical protein
MHKKAFFLLILAGIVSATLFSATAESGSNGPVAYMHERTYRFEPVVEGTTVIHEFLLQNRGNESLEILEINSG